MLDLVSTWMGDHWQMSNYLVI